MNIALNNKKAYFVSDAHFGLPNHADSLKREKLLVQWLNEIEDQTAVLFLVGDIFDFWWEYKRSVPKYFLRLFGKLAEFTDKGIPVHFFYGNHDLWCRYNYFQDELGLTVHTGELTIQLDQKTFYIAHGDGLGPGDKSYKALKKGFHSPVLQWVFSQLHPDFGQWLGKAWSSHRKYEHLDSNTFFGTEEFSYRHSQALLQEQHYDYFVYGHRHSPVILPIGNNSHFVNTGDWLQHFTFGEFDGSTFQLLNYPARDDYSNYATQQSLKPMPR